MSTVLISVFDDDEQASRSVGVLQSMASEGAVELSALATVKRHTDYRLTVEGSELPMGVKPLVVGLVAGTLVGLLFGPMGAAVGGVIGATGGIAQTAAAGDSASDFLDTVAKRLGPGKSAVIAELNGEVDQKLGSRLEELGGTLFWTSRKEILRQQQRDRTRQIIADERRRTDG